MMPTHSGRSSTTFGAAERTPNHAATTSPQNKSSLKIKAMAVANVRYFGASMATQVNDRNGNMRNKNSPNSAPMAMKPNNRNSSVRWL